VNERVNHTRSFTLAVRQARKESAMIWDVHTHLSGVEGRTPEERMAKLIEFAERMGVDRVCLSMGMTFLQDPTPKELRQQNDQVLAALAHYHDKAFGFVYTSGKYPDESVKEIDRCVKNGPMVGVKLWVARRAMEKDLDPIIARATELKAPVMQHTWLKTTGNFAGESTPQDLVELAKRHPKAALICGHTGGDWQLGIRAIRSTTSLYTEIAGSDPTSGFVEFAVKELGADRVLYGSDAGGRSFASQLAKVHGADIPDDAKKKILGENLKRLLTPILKDKGMKP
jgi:predicted TIM-barrel fold metal-dependent hydrolase